MERDLRTTLHLHLGIEDKFPINWEHGGRPEERAEEDFKSSVSMLFPNSDCMSGGATG